MEVKSEYVTILFSHIYWNQKENFLSVWFGGYFNYGTVLKIFKNYIEKEKKGEISMDDVKKYLDNKYKVKQ